MAYIGFDLAAGTVVTNQFEGLFGLTISADQNGSGIDLAMIFDAANPTGGDSDLAFDDQGGVLIISEDGDSSDPDDAARGGQLTFEFQQAVNIEEITLLDSEEGTTFSAFDADGNLTGVVIVPGFGDGERMTVDLSSLGNVSKLVAELGGSGAVDDLKFNFATDDLDCEDNPEFGDVVGTNGHDTLQGGLQDDVILALRGNDEVRAGEGDDIAYAGMGRDTVFGGEGDDTLCGEDGNDILDGQNGDDSLVGGKGNDTLSANEGDDVLDGGLGNDRLVAGPGEDTLLGGGGQDTLIGGEDGDTLDGGVGRDSLIGGAGSDLLLGGSGDDTLAANEENDTLEGGNGNDRLFGSQGDDMMTGGANRDTFLFTGATGIGNDVITDFKTSMDSVDLEGIEVSDLTFSETVDGLLATRDGTGETILFLGLDLTDLADISFF